MEELMGCSVILLNAILRGVGLNGSADTKQSSAWSQGGAYTL